jgi:hypothetical protein
MPLLLAAAPPLLVAQLLLLPLPVALTPLAMSPRWPICSQIRLAERLHFCARRGRIHFNPFLFVPRNNHTA